MGWNYRVCKKTHNCDGGETVVTYEIHEAYYTKDGSVWAVTQNATPVTTDLSPWNCESEEHCMEVLEETLEMQKQALSRPIIDLDTFVFADPDECDDEDSCECVV